MNTPVASIPLAGPSKLEPTITPRPICAISSAKNGETRQVNITQNRAPLLVKNSRGSLIIAQVQIKNIQGEQMKPKLTHAIMAYFLMIVGLNLFVLPNIRKGYELQDSLKYGLTFGIVLYGVYDFTAGAVFKKWNTKLALIDIAWGGIVFFISTYIGTKLGSS